jgi:hypothetical protein
MAQVAQRSRIRSFLRLVVLTGRWLALAVAVLTWLIIVPIIDLVSAIFAWVARQVKAARRRSS